MKRSRAEYRSPFAPQSFDFLHARRAVTMTPYMNSRQKLVMHTLLHFADNETGEMYPSQATVAECAGLSRRAVNATIEELRELLAIETSMTLRTVQRHGPDEREGNDIPGALVMRISMKGLLSFLPGTGEHEARSMSVMRLVPARPRKG